MFVKGEAGSYATIGCRLHSTKSLQCTTPDAIQSKPEEFTVQNMNCDENFCNIDVDRKGSATGFIVTARCEAEMIKGRENGWYDDNRKFCYGVIQFAFTGKGVRNLGERLYYPNKSWLILKICILYILH